MVSADRGPGERRRAEPLPMKRHDRQPHQRRAATDAMITKAATTAEIAAGSVHRRHQDGHADRMNRVDLVVGAARQIVRLEIGREVFLVVEPLVVVLDLEIAVAPEALRDHQVMRLIAAGRARCP